jgi:hypothetical protein
MYFVEDIAMLKIGKPPVDTLRTSFDSQVTGCLCAGARDLALQRYPPPRPPFPVSLSASLSIFLSASLFPTAFLSAVAFGGGA